ncbi:SURF1 family protein [Sphingomonas colocasiae]|uniref:SURF1-like protein n=1 Tax=Sphingomonas colocasiae TaxID=1848973 RepID=A0ABS7PVK9_9SPHN|nr:SURF1 family protein [Sphingomonas colocasiae]MBY8825395.1 SURF1 family protein [Sphingomonas colocasiae]
MKRWPIIPTIIVAAAILIMIALGIWQLRRADEKEALIAVYAANQSKGEIAYPTLAPIPEYALFRPSSANCLAVTGWRKEAGRSADGQSGYRFIAECRTGAEGPGLLADMGVGRDPQAVPKWTGGMVHGRIGTEPQHTSLIDQLRSKAPPPRPMLISLQAAPGLSPSARPSPEDIPNNHLAYAVQWFLFAGIAGIIYWLALKRRRRAQTA